MKPIQQIAYEKYQLDWMLRHGYSLQDLMQELHEYQCGSEDSKIVPAIFNDWQKDSGFHGELWACFDEFCETEYRDSQYIKFLLTENEYAEYKKNISLPDIITKETIRDGIHTNLIQIVSDPYMYNGTVCKIADSWFYFGGTTAEELSPDEYVANVPEEDIINEIFETLEDFRKDEFFVDEYNYYRFVLFNKSSLEKERVR